MGPGQILILRQLVYRTPIAGEARPACSKTNTLQFLPAPSAMILDLIVRTSGSAVRACSSSLKGSTLFQRLGWPSDEADLDRALEIAARRISERRFCNKGIPLSSGKCAGICSTPALGWRQPTLLLLLLLLLPRRRRWRQQQPQLEPV